MCVGRVRYPVLTKLAMIMAALFSVFAVSCAYASDNFPGTTITGATGSVAGTNVGATGQAGEPTTYPAAGTLNTMWYSWTAPSAGVVTANTCNLTGETLNDFDLALKVYTGAAVNTLTTIASDDDATGCAVVGNANFGASVSFNATGGTTYRFQVDGYQALTGNFTLRWGLASLVIAQPDPVATEGGDTATFSVRLASPPGTTPPTTQAANSTTALTIPNVVVTLGTSPQCTFSVSTLTFTQANWSTPQTVVVTAIDDAAVEGTHACAPASVTASGGAYAGISATPPVTTINDNENPNFTISKSASPATISAPGTITYTITVDNNGSALLTGPSITDSLLLGAAARALTTGPTLISGDTNSNGQIEDTETWIYTATYNVTQADINAVGNFSNTATFTTTQTGAKTSTAAVTSVSRTPQLTLLKTYAYVAPGDDANSNGLADNNDKVTYSFKVTNSGNVTMTNVQINETFLGLGTPPVPAGEALTTDVAPAGDSTDATANNSTWSTLAPGDSVTFTGTYIVTQADVDAG